MVISSATLGTILVHFDRLLLKRPLRALPILRRHCGARPRRGLRGQRQGDEQPFKLPYSSIRQRHLNASGIAAAKNETRWCAMHGSAHCEKMRRPHYDVVKEERCPAS